MSDILDDVALAGTTTTANQQDAKSTLFLGLPAEIRVLIYEYALSIDNPDSKRPWFRNGQIQPVCITRPTTALLRLNRQIYHEAIHMLYAGTGDRVYRFDNFSSCAQFITRIGASRRYITSIAIGTFDLRELWSREQYKEIETLVLRMTTEMDMRVVTCGDVRESIWWRESFRHTWHIEGLQLFRVAALRASSSVMRDTFGDLAQCIELNINRREFHRLWDAHRPRNWGGSALECHRSSTLRHTPFKRVSDDLWRY